MNPAGESILEVQRRHYGEHAGPPMLPHAAEDPEAIPPPQHHKSRKRRRRCSNSTKKKPPPVQPEPALPKHPNPPPESTCALPASELPAGFPPELAFRALSAYATIRTLSLPLRLSPFTPNVFLRALYLPFPNRLLGSIHVHILRILLCQLHMGYHWRENAVPVDVTKKRRHDNIRWPLRAGDNLRFLDLYTWPIFYDDYCHLTADVLYAQINDETDYVDVRTLDTSGMMMDEPDPAATHRTPYYESSTSAGGGRRVRNHISVLYTEDVEDDDNSEEDFRADGAEGNEDDDDDDDEFVVESRPRKRRKPQEKIPIAPPGTATSTGSRRSEMTTTRPTTYGNTSPAARPYVPLQYAFQTEQQEIMQLQLQRLQLQQRQWSYPYQQAQMQHQGAFRTSPLSPSSAHSLAIQYALMNRRFPMTNNNTFYAANRIIRPPATMNDFPVGMNNYAQMQQALMAASGSLTSSISPAMPSSTGANANASADSAVFSSSSMQSTMTASAGSVSHALTTDQLSIDRTVRDMGTNGYAIDMVHGPRLEQDSLATAQNSNSSNSASSATRVASSALGSAATASKARVSSAMKQLPINSKQGLLDRSVSVAKRRSCNQQHVLKEDDTWSDVEEMSTSREYSHSRQQTYDELWEEDTVVSATITVEKDGSSYILNASGRREAVSKKRDKMASEEKSNFGPLKAPNLQQTPTASNRAAMLSTLPTQQGCAAVSSNPARSTVMAASASHSSSSLPATASSTGAHAAVSSTMQSTMASFDAVALPSVQLSDNRTSSSVRCGVAANGTAAGMANSPLFQQESSGTLQNLKSLNSACATTVASAAPGTASTAPKALVGSAMKSLPITEASIAAKQGLLDRSVFMQKSPSEHNASSRKESVVSATKTVDKNDPAYILNAFIRGDAVSKLSTNDKDKTSDKIAFEEKLNEEMGLPSDEEGHWRHFGGPLKAMRMGTPYHLLSVEQKLAILEFLLSELLTVEEIASEISERHTATSCFHYPYGVLPSSEELDNLDNEDECAVCRQEGELICCDGCPSSYHKSCLEMPDDGDLPEGKWLCPECELKDPAAFGPLDGGRKSSLDWFSAADLVGAKQGPSTSNENLRAHQHTSEQLRNLWSEPLPAASAQAAGGSCPAEFLVVHGFVFMRRRERLCKEKSCSMRLVSRHVLEELLAAGLETCQRWPLVQIPANAQILFKDAGLAPSTGYFRQAERYNPSLYVNKYRKAPLPRLIRRVAHSHLLNYEVRCASANTDSLAMALAYEMTNDQTVAKSLRSSWSLFNPYEMVKSFLLKIQNDLLKASLLDEFWKSSQTVEDKSKTWSNAVQDGRSIKRLAHLTLRLVDHTHLRAFEKGWFHVPRAKSKVQNTINDGTTVDLPINFKPEDESSRRHWERCPVSSLPMLVSRTKSNLGDWIFDLRPDLGAAAVRSRKRKLGDLKKVKDSHEGQKSASPERGNKKQNAESEGHALDRSELDAANASSETGMIANNLRFRCSGEKEEEEGKSKNADRPIQDETGLSEMALRIRAQKRLKIVECETEAKEPYLTEQRWPIAGRQLFKPVGHLPKSTVRYLARNAGGRVAPFVVYSPLYEVGQVSHFHIWRKRMISCSSFEELLMLLRILGAFLDVNVLRKCTSLAQRFRRGKGPTIEVLWTQRDLQSGLEYHLVGKPGSRSGQWISSLNVDLGPLVFEREKRRRRVVEFVRDRRAKKKQKKIPKKKVKREKAETKQKRALPSLKGSSAAWSADKSRESILADHRLQVQKLVAEHGYQSVPPAQLEALRLSNVRRLKSLYSKLGMNRTFIQLAPEVTKVEMETLEIEKSQEDSKAQTSTGNGSSSAASGSQKACFKKNSDILKNAAGKVIQAHVDAVKYLLQKYAPLRIPESDLVALRSMSKTKLERALKAEGKGLDSGDLLAVLRRAEEHCTRAEAETKVAREQMGMQQSVSTSAAYRNTPGASESVHSSIPSSTNAPARVQAFNTPKSNGWTKTVQSGALSFSKDSRQSMPGSTTSYVGAPYAGGWINTVQSGAPSFSNGSGQSMLFSSNSNARKRNNSLQSGAPAFPNDSRPSMSASSTSFDIALNANGWNNPVQSVAASFPNDSRQTIATSSIRFGSAPSAGGWNFPNDSRQSMSASSTSFGGTGSSHVTSTRNQVVGSSQAYHVPSPGQLTAQDLSKYRSVLKESLRLGSLSPDALETLRDSFLAKLQGSLLSIGISYSRDQLLVLFTEAENEVALEATSKLQEKQASQNGDFNCATPFSNSETAARGSSSSEAARLPKQPQRHTLDQTCGPSSQSCQDGMTDEATFDALMQFTSMQSQARISTDAGGYSRCAQTGSMGPRSGAPSGAFQTRNGLSHNSSQSDAYLPASALYSPIGKASTASSTTADASFPSRNGPPLGNSGRQMQTDNNMRGYNTNGGQGQQQNPYMKYR